MKTKNIDSYENLIKHYKQKLAAKKIDCKYYNVNGRLNTSLDVLVHWKQSNS